MMMIALSQLNIEMSCMVRHEQLTMMKGGMTMINMNEVVTGVVLTKVCSISPDSDSKKEGVKKTITLRMSYEGLTLGDIFAKALKDDVISWANGAGGRKNFDNLKHNQVVEVSAKSPGSGPAADPMTAIIASAKAANMTVEEYVINELKKRQ